MVYGKSAHLSEAGRKRIRHKDQQTQTSRGRGARYLIGFICQRRRFESCPRYNAREWSRRRNRLLVENLHNGSVAQSGLERLTHTEEVDGSNPFTATLRPETPERVPPPVSAPFKT